MQSTIKKIKFIVMQQTKRHAAARRWCAAAMLLTAVAFASDDASLEDYLLFAEQTIHIGSNVAIHSGDIGANSRVALRPNASMPATSTIRSDAIHLANEVAVGSPEYNHPAVPTHSMSGKMQFSPLPAAPIFSTT